jgi:hypothetical protein
MRDGWKVDIPEQWFIAQQLRQAQNDTNFIILKEEISYLKSV